MKHIDHKYVMTHPEAKQAVLDWCNAHGINTNTVPLDAYIDIEDDTYLDIEVYDTTSAGLTQWDEEKQQPKMRWLRVQYGYPFPAEALTDGGN